MSIPAPLEKDIQSACLATLQARGHYGIRINSGGMLATNKAGKKRFIKFNREPGCSDLICCIAGRFVTVEVKRPGHRTDPKRAAEQASFAERVAKAGGIALTVESADEMVRDLKEAGLWE